MMDLGVLIDIGHASERAIADLKPISKTHRNYPVFVSHAWFRDRLKPKGRPFENLFYDQTQELPLSKDTVQFVKDTGGIVGHFMGPDPNTYYLGSGVKLECEGSSQSVAQGLAWGIDQGVNVALATDFMGLARGVVPRKEGVGQCLGNEQQQHQQRNTLGSGTPEFDHKGLAHIGLLPALMDDLKVVGLKEKHLAPVRDWSAEHFVQTWERAWKRRKFRETRGRRHSGVWGQEAVN